MSRRAYTRRGRNGKRVHVRASTGARSAPARVKRQRRALRRELGPNWKKKLGGGHGKITRLKKQARRGNTKALAKVRAYNQRRATYLRKGRS